MSQTKNCLDDRPWLKTYAQLGKDWNEVPALPANTLSDLVRSHAEKWPERAALVYLGGVISWQKLNALADRFANALLEAGCNAGDVIAINFPNMPQYVVAFIAASRIGVITTSVSPLSTPSEIVQQANDSGVRVLLTLDALYGSTGAHYVGKIPTLREVWVSGAMDLHASPAPLQRETEVANGVSVRALVDVLEQTTDDAVVRTVSADDVLYLQYTGGTTGKPKGAMLTSRNILLNNIQADVFYGYRMAQETVASAFPLFHIGGAAVLFNALRTASTFILLPDPRNIEHFCAEMRAFPPTILAAVPTLYQMLVNTPSFLALDFSNLRVCVSGAAPFSPEQIQALEKVVGAGRFCEVYGMTETSPVQTLNPAERFKVGCVGIPVPATDVRIVDAVDGVTPMPYGEPGEIIVSGPQVMKGYWGMPEATEKSIRELDGKLWMFTGDIGAMDDEGYVRICDRSKDMLIVGGYKVFSVEVEAKVQSLPFVELCAVVGRPDTARPGNDIVQLYVQLRAAAREMARMDGGDENLKNEIVAFCREQMAPYKIPKEIYLVDAVPLTSVGKIDKKALRT